jgi:hypothetical protein
MPISLRKIAANTAHVTFQAGETPDETVTIIYYPARVTEQFFTAFQVFQSVQDADVMAGFDDFNKALAGIIQDWDVFEDDEQTQKFPLDPARFGELPIALRMQAYVAISGDIRPEAIAPQVTTQS